MTHPPIRFDGKKIYPDAWCSGDALQLYVFWRCLVRNSVVYEVFCGLPQCRQIPGQYFDERTPASFQMLSNSSFMNHTRLHSLRY
jgi:hypothetical protein